MLSEAKGTIVSLLVYKALRSLISIQVRSSPASISSALLYCFVPFTLLLLLLLLVHVLLHYTGAAYTFELPFERGKQDAIT